jgi:hypothetical protein
MSKRRFFDFFLLRVSGAFTGALRGLALSGHGFSRAKKNVV